MRYLTIIRHAKSSWDQPGLVDHDRPLNERGLHAAPAVGTFMLRMYFGGSDDPPLLPAPDRIVSSTARRALTTAQIIRERLNIGAECLQLDSRLYLAEAPAILRVVQGLDDHWQHVCLFGHNPGMHDFANRMLARAKIPRMPTCTAVIIGLPHRFWVMSDWNEAQLIAHITPKMLERRFPEVWPGISVADGDD